MSAKGEVLILPRREKTQYRQNWPFLYSVDPGRGLVRNVPLPRVRRAFVEWALPAPAVALGLVPLRRSPEKGP